MLMCEVIQIQSLSSKSNGFADYRVSNYLATKVVRLSSRGSLKKIVKGGGKEKKWSVMTLGEGCTII